MPCVWDVSIAGQRVTRLLVEPVPQVGIFALSQCPSGDVSVFIEVVPGDASSVPGGGEVAVRVVIVEVPIALKTT